jgi:CheY-like chemotaxis protein
MSIRVILIADDDAADVYFLTRALQEILPCFLVRSVADGKQAIDYLAGNGDYSDRTASPFPAHMFLDLKMPLISGLEVLQWLRAQPPEIGQLPVTVLSGSELASDIERVKDLDADYIVKPIEYSALRALVTEFKKRFFA